VLIVVQEKVAQENAKLKLLQDENPGLAEAGQPYEREAGFHAVSNN
jgi:hypothetical protein